MDTNGFYKLDGELLYGPYISGPNYELIDAEHTQYTYPVNGWYWFETEDSAYTYFGLEKPAAQNNDISAQEVII